MENTIEFHKIAENDEKAIEELSAFATKIVKEHYDPIIGVKQNDYMIRQFQSPESITSQIARGDEYYLVYLNGEKAGFIAFYEKQGKLYLSKFYVHKEKRGKKVSSAMFQFIKEQAKEKLLPAIFLNVHKKNLNSISVYYHLGFKKAYEEKKNVGNGFYMDDYILEYKL